MAYIPDEAILDSGDISQTAFRVFCFYCKAGSMSNNRITVSLETVAKFIGIDYSNACRYNAELKRKGWITKDGKETVLIKGFPQKMWQKTAKNVSKSAEKTDGNYSFPSEKLTEITVFEDSESEKTVKSVSKKLQKTSVSLYKEEPAFLNQQEKEKNNSYELSKKKIKKISFEIFPIPRMDVDPELWITYLESRAKKQALTEFGYNRLIQQLARLPNFDLNDRISEAIDRGWIGLIFKNDLENGGTNGKTQIHSSTKERRQQDAIAEHELYERIEQRVRDRETGLS